MRISAASWRLYQRAHRELQDAARKEFDVFFNSLPYGWDDETTLRALQAKAIELVEKYGLADSSLSAAFYDELMAAQGASLPACEALPPDVGFVRGDIASAAERATSTETMRSLMSSVVSGNVKRSGIRSMQAAALRDRTAWAWVCIGDTCAFCRTLGSRGWQQASKDVKAGRHAEHIHDNCDCQFVVKAPGSVLEIEGYDPDALLEQYDDAHGDINAMRRAEYTPEFAAERNARRREQYAAARAESMQKDE